MCVSVSNSEGMGYRVRPLFHERSSLFIASGLLSISFLIGCSLPALPAHFLDQRIDQTLTFEDLSKDPVAAEGRTILLGGEVVSIQEAESGMMLEVLELPLSASHAPVMDRTQSRGRFLLLDPDRKDEDHISVGSRLTIIGRVKGAVPQKNQEEEPAYPLLVAERIATWPSWPSPSVFGPFGTNCGPFRGFWPFGGNEPFTGRIYPTC